jgi:hypothetical protein
MTFKDLQKLVQSQTETGSSVRLIQGLPFWIFNQDQHKLEYRRTRGKCCFWHLIGPPQKDNHDMPVLPYQKMLYEVLQNRKHIWIKKSRGLGVTTFFLYWIAYCCLTRYEPGDRVFIVVGPRIDSAEDLIARFKGLFQIVSPSVYSELTRQQSTVAIINGVRVEAFPSHHVDTMRGLTNVRFILSDETDFYPPFQQKEVRAVMEGYIGKPNSDPNIVLVSTPKAPGGLMQQIELEQDSLYHKLFFDYRYGLEGPYPIYSQEQIDKARLSPEFPREYELQYLGVIGNVFSPKSIELCQKIEYNPSVWKQKVKSTIGLDPSFGSSSFGIVATQLYDQRIHVVFAEEYERPLFQDMISKVWELKNKLGYVSNIYVDAANPEIWQALKKEFNEPFSEQYIRDQIADCKKYNSYIEERMLVVATPFSTEGRKMLEHAKYLIEDPESLVAIHPSFQKLITALRTAQATEYKLQKEETSYNDILDAFILSLQFYRRSKA